MLEAAVISTQVPNQEPNLPSTGTAAASGPTSSTWQSRAAEKQARCRAGIPQEWLISPSILASTPLSPTDPTNLLESSILRDSNILSDLELQITEKYNAEELLAKLASGELTSLEVTVAFSKRAAVAQQLVRFIYLPPNH